MTYAKQLSEDRMLALWPTLERLEALAENEKLILSDTRARIDALRADLYTYLHNRGTKSLYRLYREGPETLAIKRLPQPKPSISLQADLGVAFARECLLEADDTTECLALINQARTASRLSAADAMSAYDEWARINGQESSP